MANRSRKIATGVAVAAVALAGLAVLAIRVRASDPPPAEVARRWLDRVDYEYAKRPSLVTLLESAQAVVKVRVDAIEFPIWNSTSGLPWDGNESTTQRVYSKVTATVESTWIGTSPGDTVSFYVQGDGTSRWEGADTPPYRSISGGFIEGTLFVLALARRPLEFEAGNREEWGLAASFEGNWRIDGASAVGSDTQRSLPVDGLREALTAAWRTLGR